MSFLGLRTSYACSLLCSKILGMMHNFSNICFEFSCLLINWSPTVIFIFWFRVLTSSLQTHKQSPSLSLKLVPHGYYVSHNEGLVSSPNDCGFTQDAQFSCAVLSLLFLGLSILLTCTLSFKVH